MVEAEIMTDAVILGLGFLCGLVVGVIIQAKYKVTGSDDWPEPGQ